MALVGNMRNFFSSVETVATLGFQNGIVKYATENQENKLELKKVISTVFFSLLAVCLLLGVCIYFFSAYFNNEVLGIENRYDFVFKILALALPWYVANVFIVSIINGFGKFKTVIYINIIGNILGLLVSIALIYKFHVSGALISVALTPSLLIFISFYYINKSINLSDTISLGSFDFTVIKNLSSYSLMAFVYGFVGPLVYLSIRNNIIAKIGIEQAGYWSAMERISANYLLFISTLLTVYFLPKLILAKDNKETKKVFWSYYKTIIPIFILVLLAIYLLRFFIVRLLFTEELLPVADLFLYQIIGDFFKAVSLILGYQFFAKKMTVAFIITELMSLGILYFSSNYLVGIFNIEGMVMAHAFTYGIYLIVLSVYFRKSLILNFSR